MAGLINVHSVNNPLHLNIPFDLQSSMNIRCRTCAGPDIFDTDDKSGQAADSEFIVPVNIENLKSKHSFSQMLLRSGQVMVYSSTLEARAKGMSAQTDLKDGRFDLESSEHQKTTLKKRE
jgi:hypothetical protein